MNIIEKSDMWACKHCIAGVDYSDGNIVPACDKSGLSCETVLQYGDEDCDLQGGKK